MDGTRDLTVLASSFATVAQSRFEKEEDPNGFLEGRVDSAGLSGLREIGREFGLGVAVLGAVSSVPSLLLISGLALCLVPISAILWQGLALSAILLLGGLLLAYLCPRQPPSLPPIYPQTNLDPIAAELGAGYTINEQRKQETPNTIVWRGASDIDFSSVRISDLIDSFDEVFGAPTREEKEADFFDYLFDAPMGVTRFRDVSIQERKNLRCQIETVE